MVFKITFHGDKGLFKLTEGCTAYYGEGEVLIQDGLRYQITGKKERVDEKSGLTYTEISLLHPPT